MTPPRLTHKQTRFVELYLGECAGNASGAARGAGYKQPEQSGSENLRKPPVVAEIRRRTEKSTVRSDMTRDERREFLARVIRGEVLDRGEEVTVRDRLKALELLGRMSCDFVDKTVHELNLPTSEIIGRLQATIRAHAGALGNGERGNDDRGDDIDAEYELVSDTQSD